MTEWLIAWGVVATLSVIGTLVFFMRIRREVNATRGAAELVADDSADLNAELQRTREQRDDLFSRIDGIVAESTKNKSLYLETGASHAAAQAMMLREIESLAKQYSRLVAEYQRVTGKKPRRMEPLLNVQLQRVADDFRESHVHPEQLQQLMDQVPPPEGEGAPSRSAPG